MRTDLSFGILNVHACNGFVHNLECELDVYNTLARRTNAVQVGIALSSGVVVDLTGESNQAEVKWYIPAISR